MSRSGDGKQFFKDGSISKFLLHVERCVIKGLHCIYNGPPQDYCIKREEKICWYAG